MSQSERILHALNEAVTKLAATERAKHEPIAIVGMGCRFPQAYNRNQFWELLRDGVDAISDVPESRWSLDEWYDPAAPDKHTTRHGGFIDDAEFFDAHFFGISPREALSMDPQHRIFLEVAWEAIEQAGLTQPALKGSQSGVFIGVTNNDYAWRAMQTDTPLDIYFGTGNTRNALAGRLSYWLGLQGASMVIDTACSSSLSAVHLACTALRSGECDLAFTGGVNLILAPEVTTTLSHASMLAPDGRCKTFSNSADGFVRSEGCGVIILKRLSDAIADNDHILATIRGSAVNQDGASSGLTAPNGPAQQAVIRQALAQAKLDPLAVDYVEAHGTGTSLGDPIEVQALANVYGRNRQTPLLLGSVKTNIGHAESAAGIAGLIKLVLSLEHNTIPPHLHFDEPNALIKWDALPVAIPVEGQPWTGDERIAGVSSFGISGTNAHVLVSGFSAEKSPVQHEKHAHLLTLSAKSDAALRQLAQKYRAQLETESVDFIDMARGAAFGRTHFPHRFALVADNAAQALEQLQAYDEQILALGAHDAIASRRRLKTAFLFTGQGGHHPDMGRDLYLSHPVFRHALDECNDLFKQATGAPLSLSVYCGEAANLESTAQSQPALFALAYALVAQWEAWGVVPDYILGHSMGELAAACVSGVVSVADGLKIAIARGQLVIELPPTGAMVVVFAAPALVEAALTPHADSVSIAAYNAPDNVVISGDAERVRQLVAAFNNDGIRTVPLPLVHAFHSPALLPMIDAFSDCLATVQFKLPKRKMISTVSGELMGEEVASAEYWIKNLLQPVQFERAIRTLDALNIDVYIEIGATPTLLTVARRCFPDGDAHWLPSLHKERGATWQMLDTLAAWHVRGGKVRWDGVFTATAYNHVTLPDYAFQRERYWLAPTPPQTRSRVTEQIAQGEIDPLFAQLSAQFETSEHDLLRRALAAVIAQHAGEVSAESLDWLYEIIWQRQHQLNNVLPPTFLPAPEKLRQQLTPHLDQTNARTDVRAYLDLIAHLDRATVDYIVIAFDQMGWQWQRGQRFTTDEMQRKLRISPQHDQFLGRLLAILAEENYLTTRDGRTWHVQAVPEESFEMVGDAAIEWTILNRCGEQLAHVLTGQQDPLYLLFPEDGQDSAEILYQHAFGATIMNECIEQTVQAALATHPPGRTLRVLEIGAGTGGTTAGVLNRLPADTTHYTFTDISTAFTRKAEQKFAEYDFIAYQRLDIEQDPSAQGFSRHHYDLIIASNVIHATRDLSKTLTHTHQLLAPNGMLIMIEGIARMRWVDLIFGMTAGWWHFDDQWRVDHALVSAEKWQTILHANGFSQATALATEDGVFSRQAVIIAQTPARKPEPISETWLIVGNPNQLGTALVQQAQAQGVQPHLIENVHTVEASDWENISTKIAAAQQILYLAETSDPVSDPFSAARPLCEPLLMLVQQLARQAVATPPRLTIVTHNTIEPDAAPIRLDAATQSVLWGMRRTIALEHPEWQPRLIDVDRAFAPHDAAALLWAESSDQSAAEDEILLRSTGRYVPRLVRHESVDKDTLEIRPNANYLITGGMGGLGLLTADWLVQQGATHLTLLGRSQPKPTAQAAVQRLEAQGVTVTIALADVGDAAQMQAVFSQIDPPLCGVIHAAGHLDDGVLSQQSWARYAPVLAAKVAGTWHLHELSQPFPLDFFVLYSSTVGLFGSAGQSNHAAASAFQNQFAHYRRGLGLPAQVIDWGAWATVGAAAERKINVQALGANLIEPAAGIRALAHIMQHPVIQVAAVPIQWDQLPPALVEKPLFSALGVVEESAETAQTTFLEQLTLLPPHKQRAHILDTVRRQLSLVLGVRPTHLQDLQIGFFDLGMDSLTAIEFRNNLQKIVDQPLPSTLAFDYPTLDTLTAHVIGLFEIEQQPAAVIAPVDETLAQLDEDELANLLDAELSALGMGD